MWEHVNSEDGERHFVTLREKRVCQAATNHTDSKKHKISIDFLNIRVAKVGVSLRQNANFNIALNGHIQIQMFFFTP